MDEKLSCSADSNAESAPRGERKEWSKPDLKYFRASDADLNPGSHTSDTEGFIS